MPESGIFDRNREFVLLTGATGFLGQYLMVDLLSRHQPLAVLVRRDKRLTAAERVEAILQRVEREQNRPIPRPVILEGDVGRHGLGLSASDRDWAENHCGSMLHNAAVVSFEAASRDSEPWITNLGGTEHVLDFCQAIGIQDLHYVSSAYVCGNRETKILETDLDCGQQFRNDYENSKFLAEKAVQETTAIRQRTVYRPSIITSDSRSGYTCSYHGMMWYLRLFSMLIPQQPRNASGQYQTDIELPIDGDEPHDVVCVDWVSRSIVELFLQPATRGNVFHITAQHPTTIREVIDHCCQYFNSTGVRYLGRAAERQATSNFSELVFDAAKVYHAYEAVAPRFDRSNLLKFLPECHSPQIDREMVIRFLEFGKQDRWGKRRIEKPTLAHSAPISGRKVQTV